MPELHIRSALPTELPAAADDAEYDIAFLALGDLRAVNLEDFVRIREHLAHLPKAALVNHREPGAAKVATALGAQTHIPIDRLDRVELEAAFDSASVHHWAQRYSADSEERLRAIFESMPSAVVVTDVTSMRVVEANRAALEILGIDDPSQLLGRRLAEVCAGAAVLSAVSPVSDHRVAELDLAGDRRVAVTYAATLTAAGRQLVTTFRDLTAARKSEERRQRAEQLAQVGEMAARLSHEIKNPLASILSGLRLLEMDTHLSPDHLEVVQAVLGQARLLSNTVRSLLDQARPTPMTPRPIPVTDVIQNSVVVYATLARSERVRLTVNPPCEDFAIIADPLWIGRAISNLVINAIEASPAEGVVEVSWGTLNEHEVQTRFPGFRGAVAFIAVADDGPGMSRETLDQAFHPYFTTKSGGTGLGLATTRDVVDYHGGAIRVSSGVGRGTTFEVLLPIGDVDAHPCWETRHCEGDCSNCSLPNSGTGFCCWLSRVEQPELGEHDWSESCRHCVIFGETNLAGYAKHRLEVIAESGRDDLATHHLPVWRHGDGRGFLPGGSEVK